MNNRKHILLLCIVVSLFSSCGTVVYRVNPDSLPVMTMSEARDAVERSLAMAEKSYAMDSVKVNYDLIEIDRINAGGVGMSTATATQYRYAKAYYNMMPLEVRKLDDKYITTFPVGSIQSAVEYMTVSWKSEADARAFVDAAYVLSKKRNNR